MQQRLAIPARHARPLCIKLMRRLHDTCMSYACMHAATAAPAPHRCGACGACREFVTVSGSSPTLRAGGRHGTPFSDTCALLVTAGLFASICGRSCTFPSPPIITTPSPLHANGRPPAACRLQTHAMAVVHAALPCQPSISRTPPARGPDSRQRDDNGVGLHRRPDVLHAYSRTAA